MFVERLVGVRFGVVSVQQPRQPIVLKRRQSFKTLCAKMKLSIYVRGLGIAKHLGASALQAAIMTVALHTSVNFGAAVASIKTHV